MFNSYRAHLSGNIVDNGGFTLFNELPDCLFRESSNFEICMGCHDCQFAHTEPGLLGQEGGQACETKIVPISLAEEVLVSVERSQVQLRVLDGKTDMAEAREP